MTDLTKSFEPFQLYYVSFTSHEKGEKYLMGKDFEFFLRSKNISKIKF
jgi:hypothetical protein